MPPTSTRKTVVLPAFGLGCAPLANLYTPVANADAEATVRTALADDVRFFDTAPLYGAGLSEYRLRAPLHEVARDTIVISTKVGKIVLPPSDPTADPREKPGTGTYSDLSYDGVHRSLEASLARLGTDRVDIVHVHDPDDADAAIDGAFRALHELRDQGVIRAFGAGMNEVAMPLRFAREVDIDCLLIAGRYTLLDQTALDDLLPECLSRGIQIVAAGVYNTGILANPVRGAYFNYRPAPDEVVSRARAIERVCADHGVSLKAAAVQFPRTHPAVSSVVVGARSPSELEQAVAASRAVVPDELWADLAEQGLLSPSVLS